MHQVFWINIMTYCHDILSGCGVLSSEYNNTSAGGGGSSHYIVCENFGLRQSFREEGYRPYVNLVSPQICESYYFGNPFVGEDHEFVQDFSVGRGGAWLDCTVR